MKRLFTVAVLVALVAAVMIGFAAVSGCSSSGSGSTTPSGGGSSAGETAVTISNFAFSPGSVTINVGESVMWTNEDSATHTVVGDGGVSSGDLAQGKTYSKTFDTAGTYAYRCSIHPSMTGTVIVK